MADDDAERFVLLCYDVLLEVLRYGNRRRLVKLSRVGRRFHQIIERYFGKTPFLRLKLYLEKRFFKNLFACFWSVFAIK